MRKAVLTLGVISTALALAACQKNPLMVKRSPCPAVAIPAYTGSVTRFEPAQSRDANAIQMTAQLSDVQGNCLEGKEYLSTDVSYLVTAQRRHAEQRQEVYLPIFIAMAQGGNVLVSKQVSGVQLVFEPGQLRAESRGGAQAQVHRSAIALPPEIQERIQRERKPDEADALIDPMSNPQVRAAVRAASFEVLVGFQLDDASLAYNVGK